MTPTSIQQLHRAKTGKVSDKWLSYLNYYDKEFAAIRDRPIKMLEIGVQNGGSLETWATFFHNALRIVGCDVDPRCSRLHYEDPRIQIAVQDACSQQGYLAIKSLCNEFDLIIDDGSHQSDDILSAFVRYFPELNPGGTYIIEDACCLYMKNFGGGILNNRSALAFFKLIVDIINYQHWRADVDLASLLQPYFNRETVPGFIQDGWVESIEFRNSLIIVRKANQPGHNKLGDRLVVGNETMVQDWGGKFPGNLAN